MARKKVEPAKKTTKTTAKAKKAPPTEIESIDNLLSSDEIEYVDQGLALLESLMEDMSINMHFKTLLKFDDNGQLTEPSNYSVDAQLGLLFLMANHHRNIALKTKSLDLTDSSKKVELVSQLSIFTKLETLRIEINYQDEINDEQEIELLNQIAELKSLENLKLDNWNFSTIPEMYFSTLKKVLITYNRNIEIPSVADVMKLPAVLRFMYLALHKSRNRWGSEKFKYDGCVSGEEMYEHFKDCMTISADGLLKVKPESFYGALEMDSRGLFAIHSYIKQNFKNLHTLQISSEQIALLQATPNLENLTLTTNSAKFNLDLSNHPKVKKLILINTPASIKLKNDIDKIEFHGNMAGFEFIQKGRSKSTDLYEAANKFNGQFGQQGWYHRETYPKLYNLPAPTKASLKFITEEMTKSFWDLKASIFWEGYLSLDKAKFNEVLEKMPRNTQGQWSDLGEYDFLWSFFYNQKAKNLPTSIKIDNTALSGFEADPEGLYINLDAPRLIDLSKSKMQKLKIKGHHKTTLDCKLPKGLKELSIENVHLKNLDWKSCKSTLESLTLVGIDKSAIPDWTMFSKLTSLKVIKCDVDTFNKLPESLKVLNISSNPVSEFPKSILDCKKLEVLQMSNCDFTSVPDLSKLSNIKQVSLCRSLVENLAFLKGLPQLEKLQLGFHLEDMPWSRFSRRTDPKAPKTTPILPAGLSNLKELTLMDAVYIEYGAYRNHDLQKLNIKWASEGTATHALKSFKSIEVLEGYVAGNTLPMADLGISTKVVEALPHYSTWDVKSGKNHRKRRLGYRENLGEKFDAGLKLYQYLLKGN